MRATTYKIALALACLMQAGAAPIPESVGLARRQGMLILNPSYPSDSCLQALVLELAVTAF